MLLLLLPLVTALMLAGSFMFYHLGWLVVVALVPLLFFVQLATKASWSRRQKLLAIWGSGLVFCLFDQVWILHINPSTWAAGYPSAIHLISLIAWLICSLLYATNFLLFGLLAEKALAKFTSSKGFPWRSFVLIIAVWIVGEWLRAVIVSILTWGSGASIGPYWNFGALGFALATSPLGFLARFVGLFGLGGLAVAINLLVYLALRGRWRPLAWTGLIVILLANVAAFAYRPSGKIVQVGLVQTRTSGQDFQANLAALVDAQTKASDLPVNVLVLPEGLTLDNPADPTTRDQVLDRVLGGQGGAWITSGQAAGSGQSHLQTLVRERSGRIISRSDKTVLSPVGEFMPLALKWTFELTGNRSLETVYALQHQSLRGTNPLVPVSWQGVKYGILACSGIMSSVQYQTLARAGSDILINSSNLEIFNFNERYYAQVEQMARFQAIANAKPFVHVANGGYSYALTADGQLVLATTHKDLEFHSVRLQASPKKTLFAQVGEWTVVIAGIYILLNTIVKRQGSPLPGWLQH